MSHDVCNKHRQELETRIAALERRIASYENVMEGMIQALQEHDNKLKDKEPSIMLVN